MSYKPCQCSSAGFCERYKREMSKRDWKLCQTHEKRRMLFDELAGNADFGLWQSPDKGNVPKHIPKKVKIRERPINKISRKQAMGILEDNKKVMQLDKELKKANINIDKLNKSSEGLGDDIEKIFSKLGITEKLLKKVLGRECGCSKRKQFLNRLFPYFKK